MSDMTAIEASDLAPTRGQVDETCAGTPLDAWRRGDPFDGVKTAVAFVAEHPDVPAICYCHDPIPEVFATSDRRQKAAGRAWAAKEYPHLNIRLRSITLPFRGIGNDVVVVYAEVAKVRKPATA